jgi:carbon storage regulator
MLMMRRRRGESILIGESIEIHIAHIGRTRVKIAIDAPRQVRVVAKEVEMVGRENRSAAAVEPARLLAGRVARALEKKNFASPPDAAR